MKTNLGGVMVDLVPYLLTAEERALPKPDSEPESLWHGWLLQQYYHAIDGWLGGGPIMMCRHVFESAPPVRYWFPAWPTMQLCQACGERIRAALNDGRVCDHEPPLDRCHVCDRKPESGSWYTAIDYDTIDWHTSMLICDPCVESFGMMSGRQEISEGMDKLQQLANSGVSDGPGPSRAKDN